MFNINVVGYWRKIHIGGIPTHSGIFFVYENRFDAALGTVTLLRILYVGETDNVRLRILGHELMQRWKDCVQPGNELCFSTAPVPPAARTRIKAAFIFKLQPVCNDIYRDEFPFAETMIVVTGKTSLMEKSFTVGSL
jgi:hypothetical protein